MYNNIKKSDINQLLRNNFNHSISIFENIKSVTPLEQPTLDWDSFCNLLAQGFESTVKDTLLFGPYKLKENTTRGNANVEEISLLVFDIDEPQGKSFDDIKLLIKKYDCVIHTTWSHTNEQPRYRLIIRLKNKVSPIEYDAVRKGFIFFNPELSKLFDKACSDIARAYYLYCFSESNKGLASFSINEGEPLDPDLIKLPSPSNDTHVKTDFHSVANGVKEGGRNHALAVYVGGLINRGDSYDLCLEGAKKWNGNNQPPLELNELTRTLNNIWSKHHKNSNVQTINTPLQTFAPEIKQYKIIKAEDLLVTPPLPRKWVIDDFLPRNIVAALIAAGGSGKSYLAMNLAIAVASGGILFNKFMPSKEGKVVFISGEDDIAELQRRLHWSTSSLPKHVVERIGKNINFVDLADTFEAFTEKDRAGEVRMTDSVTHLIASIKKSVGSEVDLIIVDPVSRFRGGEENLAVDTTRFVQALQIFKDELNATVLCLHHVNKGAKSNGTGQNNARGSSALVDGVRLVMELSQLSEDEVKKQYGDTQVKLNILNLHCVKTNYTKPFDPIALKKGENGCLEVMTMVAGDHIKVSILREIKKTSLTKSQFKETYGDAKGGMFRLSQKELVRKLEDFEKDGLIDIKEREPMTVTMKGEALIK
jgi:RecA-family ATPase